MTARLLPSPNALNLARQPSELELAAHDVIWELFGVVDRLQQQADAYTVEDVDEARARLGEKFAYFDSLAEKAQDAKIDADCIALEGWAGA